MDGWYERGLRQRIPAGKDSANIPVAMSLGFTVHLYQQRSSSCNSCNS
jgi:hypothetical protein